MSRICAAWNRFWFEPRAPYALAVSHIVVAYCGLLFLLGRLEGFPGLPILD